MSPPPAPPPTWSDAPSRAATCLAAAAVAAVLGVAATVTFLPELHWAQDPRAEMAAAAAAGGDASGGDASGGAMRTTVAQLGPAAMGGFAVIALVVSGLAIVAAAWRGARVRWVSGGLVGLGAAAACVHLGETWRDGYTLSCWIAAAGLGLACAHLGQLEIPRRLLVGALVGIGLLLLTDALWFVLDEHALTVASYRERADAMAAARGWAPGSAERELYERRLAAPDVTGSFGLSNVLGSLTAAVAAMSLPLMLGWRRARRWAVVGAAGFVAAGGVTLLTRSKGAAAALAAGLLVVALALWWTRSAKPGRGRWLSVAGLVAVLAAVAAVVGRGLLGPPEDWTGERSVLFRWFYLQAGLDMAAAMGPVDWLRGLGVDGLARGYLLHKNPLSPESVQSLHSGFVDYALVLGVGGVAWGGALLGWLWRGGRAAVERGGDHVQRGLSPRAAGYLAAATAAAVVVIRIVVEQAALWWGPTLTLLAAGGGMAAAMAMMAARRGGSPQAGAAGAAGADPPGVTLSATGLGVFAAAVVLLTHNQIEMLFFHPPAVVLGWAIVGLAGAGGVEERSSDRAGEGSSEAAEHAPRGDGSRGHAIARSLSLAGGAVAAAVVVAVVWAGPAATAESAKASAARSLRISDPVSALAELDRAAEAAPPDRATLRWRVALRVELARAYASAGRDAAASGWLDQAAAVWRATRDDGADQAWAWRLRDAVADTREGLGLIPAGEAAERRAAILEEVVARSPYAMRDWLALGELYDALDRSSEAEAAYRRVLRLDRQRYLDPATRLDEQRRRAIEVRLEQGR